MRTILTLTLACAIGLAGGVAFAQSGNSPAMPNCGASDPVVWVNTSSKVYHMQGSKYFGKTKAGKYACKSAADASGAHLDRSEAKAGSKPPKSGVTTPPPPEPSASASSKHHRKHKSSASPQPTATPA
jgi:hypothetical protein